MIKFERQRCDYFRKYGRLSLARGWRRKRRLSRLRRTDLKRGLPFPTDYSAVQGGTRIENNDPFQGTTFFLDGKPLPGHIGSPGSWLDGAFQAKNNV